MLNMVKTAAVLLAICFGVALCLAFVDSVTARSIEERIRLDAENKRKEVMKEAGSFEKMTGWEGKTEDSVLVKEVYRAVAEGRTKGYVFNVSPKGYGGNMDLTVGIGADGRVTGVKIGENKETPGLGTKAAEPLFIDQYKSKTVGRRLETVKRKSSADNEIQAISGATITSKAVTTGVQAAADLAMEFIRDGGISK